MGQLYYDMEDTQQDGVPAGTPRTPVAVAFTESHGLELEEVRR